jgi:type IV fimbrial biogenesis protein FimT
MIVVGVIGILLAVGLPSLQDTISRISTNTQAKTLVSSLNFARSEAIKRGSVVSICASDSGTDCEQDAWSEGWLVFIDNNGDADGASGSVDVGDEILRVYQGLGGNTLTFTADIQQYDPRGFGTNAAIRTFLLCPEDDNAANAQSVEIAMTGRGRRIHDGLDCS